LVRMQGIADEIFIPDSDGSGSSTKRSQTSRNSAASHFNCYAIQMLPSNHSHIYPYTHTYMCVPRAQVRKANPKQKPNKFILKCNSHYRITEACINCKLHVLAGYFNGTRWLVFMGVTACYGGGCYGDGCFGCLGG